MTARLTVFTSTVYADVARLWHACVLRVFPGAAVEIFDDSPSQTIDPALFPGAALLRRTGERRDFHEAYNDAIRRCRTEVLAFLDTDIFVVSKDLFPWVVTDLVRPEVGAVSCVSRSRTESHGTFALFLKPDVYRRVLGTIPDGFFPLFEIPDPACPPGTWVWHDTGDLMTRAVVRSGFEVRLLNLEAGSEVVRFDGITLTRRAADWLGAEAYLRLSRTDEYFWHGAVGNALLARLHDRTFEGGERYRPPAGLVRAATLALAPRVGRLTRRLLYLARLSGGAARLSRFLSDRRTS